MLTAFAFHVQDGFRVQAENGKESATSVTEVEIVATTQTGMRY